MGAASLVAVEHKSWEPRGVMAVLGGLETGRLAWILVGLKRSTPASLVGSPRHRAKHASIEKLVLAMEMRQRHTFKEVTGDIMANATAFFEGILSPRPPFGPTP